jgi:hypothetical protein
MLLDPGALLQVVASAKNSNVIGTKAGTAPGERQIVIEMKVVLCTTQDASALVALKDHLLHPGGDDPPEFVCFLTLRNVIGRPG